MKKSYNIHIMRYNTTTHKWEKYEVIQVEGKVSLKEELSKISSSPDYSGKGRYKRMLRSINTFYFYTSKVTKQISGEYVPGALPARYTHKPLKFNTKL